MLPRASASLLEAVGIVALALLLVCHHDAPAPNVAVELDEDLVDYAGCTEVWLEDRPRCLFEPGVPLRLWITRPNASRVSVRVDGEVVTTTVDDADVVAGTRLEVMLPAGAEVLVVEVAEPPATWSLPLREWAEDIEAPAGVSTSRDVDAALGLSFELGLEGRPAAALAELDKVKSLAESYPEGRAWWSTHRGIAQWRQGRFHDAATSLAKGVLFAMRTHHPDLLVDATPLYAASLTELGYWEAAAEWSTQMMELMDSEPELFRCPEGPRVMSTLGYAHLLLARQHGRPSVLARSLLERALASMSSDGECSDPSSVPAVTLSLAEEALDRGDPAAAFARLRTIDIAAAPTADQRLRLRDAELRALQAMGRDVAELEPKLAQLEREVAMAGLPEGRWRLALQRGELLARQGRLDEAIESYREAEDEALAIARLAAVGVGRESAVTLHAESTERLVGLLARQGSLDEAFCVARVAQARRIHGVAGVAGALPQSEPRQVIVAAIQEYQALQQAIDEAVAELPNLPIERRAARRLGLVQKEQALAKLVNEILLAQSSWRPSCDDLVPRRDGELLLGLYPARDGWFVFVQDESGTELRWLAGGPTHELDDADLGEELLEPLSEHLAKVQRVRVLASGRAQDVDVHLLSWRGVPLFEHVAVAYGAELPRAASVHVAEAKPSALLVADPTEGLPQAHEEVRDAAAWMRDRGWSLEVLGVDEADREHVHAALEGVSFFYFAGHGVHEPGITPERSLPPYAGGSEGWPAHLVLKDNTMLGIHDVLMLSSAPRHVALLGCETGLPGSGGGGMSLALAFLVAGAEEVVATRIETSDVSARATGFGLLRGMEEGGMDLAEGLRAAQREMVRRGGDVGRYRVWVR